MSLSGIFDPVVRSWFENELSASGDGGAEHTAIDEIITRTIREIHNDRVTSIGNYVFISCAELTVADFPRVTSVGNYGFSACGSLTSLNLPLVERVGDYCFNTCHKIKRYVFPYLLSIGNNAFNYNTGVATIDLARVTSIGNAAFALCGALTALIMRTEAAAVLNNSNALEKTPIAAGTGFIYVPSALVDTYKAATNWTAYADRFRALEDYTVDGTITGELDPNKI